MTTLVDPDLLAAAVTAQTAGTLRIAPLASAESLPTDSDILASDDLEAATRLWDRSGFPWGGSDTFRLDYASPSARTFLADGEYSSLLADGFQGISVGVVDGAPGYDPPSEDREHVPHGGPYRTIGLREMFVAIDGFTTAETHEEHLVGSVDFAPDATTAWPDHLLLAEEALYGYGVTDVAPEARNRSTPLWSIVYGPRAAAGRPVAPLTTLSRASNLFHPDIDNLYDGLTQDQATELQAWQIGSLVVSGMLPVLTTAAQYFAHRIQTDADEPILDFLASAFQALRDEDWTATWISFGQRELPLVQQSWSEHNGEHNAEHGLGVTLTSNPLLLVSHVIPDLQSSVMPPEMFGDIDAISDFMVPRVLHSVWRDRASGDLLVLLVNWTAVEAGGPVGTFCPWLYWTDCGLHNLEHNAEHDLLTTFQIDRINDDGTETAVATGCSDAVNLLCSGTSGTVSGQDVSLGVVPAFTIQAYRLRQE